VNSYKKELYTPVIPGLARNLFCLY